MINQAVADNNTPETAQTAQKELELSHDDSRVLILEDDLTFKPLWEFVISQTIPHAKIDWVESAEIAERFIKLRHRAEKKYDLVVADIFLAGRKTGIDLWSKYGDTIQNFIFVSGLSREKFDSLMMSEEYSYPIYIQKPLVTKTCIELIKQVI